MNSNIAPKQSTKAIVRNTMLLFLRMTILMLINLYTVRVTLNALLDIDYGLFDVVAGIVTMLSCVSSVLALATQRFYSYYEVQNEITTQRKIFSVSVNLNIVLSIVVLLLFETIGLWIVAKLNIPAERYNATMWIYQFSIISFICSILQIPYLAAMLTREDMGLYTLVSTVESLLKLLVACLIGYCAMDNLVFYGFGLFIVAISLSSSYAIIGHFRYMECHYSMVKDKKLYRDFLTFSSWTFFGSVANVGLVQGNKILLNIFFGAITNSAFAIAMQINHAFSALGNSVVLAVRPSMIRSFAERKYMYLNTLFHLCNKSLFYFLIVLAIPLIYEMPAILDVWLNNVSGEKILFARCVIIYLVILLMNNPITIIVQATGEVKNYHLPVESITLLSLPVTYVFFKMGFSSEYIFYSMIVTSILAHIVRIACLKRCYDAFSIHDYCVSFLVPAICTTAVAAIILGWIHSIIAQPLLRVIIVSLVSLILLSAMMYFVVATRTEREMINYYVKSFVNHHLKKK